MVPKATAALGDWTLGAMSPCRGRWYSCASGNQAAAARTCDDRLSRANGSGQQVHAICVSENSAELDGPVAMATYPGSTVARGTNGQRRFASLV